MKKDILIRSIKKKLVNFEKGNNVTLTADHLENLIVLCWECGLEEESHEQWVARTKAEETKTKTKIGGFEDLFDGLFGGRK